MMNNPLRRTGRTTRMLLNAAAAALGGNRVCVVCANAHHAKALRREARHMVDKEAFSRMHFCGTSGWRGCTPDMVFMDHWAVEQELKDIHQTIGMLQSRLSDLMNRVIT